MCRDAEEAGSRSRSSAWPGSTRSSSSPATSSASGSTRRSALPRRARRPGDQAAGARAGRGARDRLRRGRPGRAARRARARTVRRQHYVLLLLTLDGHFTLVRPENPARRPRPSRSTACCPSTGRATRSRRTTSARNGCVRCAASICPRCPPTARRIAFAALNSLWIADTSGARAAAAAAPGRATRYLLGPVWARDGRCLLYADDRDGLLGVYRRDLATGDESALATGGRVHPALSPDGKRLAAIDMSGRLVVRDLASGTERVLVTPLGGGGLPGRPSWSPDGRYLALCDRNRLNLRFREGYNVIRVVDTDHRRRPICTPWPRTSPSPTATTRGPSGRPTVAGWRSSWNPPCCLLPVAPDGTPQGPPRTLTTEPADHPSWSGDSKTLLYLSGDPAAAHRRRRRQPRAPCAYALDQRRPDTRRHRGARRTALGRHRRIGAGRRRHRGARADAIASVEPHRKRGAAALRRRLRTAPSSPGCGTPTPTPGRAPTAAARPSASSPTGSPPPSRSAASPTNRPASARRWPPASSPGRAC